MQDKQEQELILHPEDTVLREEIARLRASLTAMLLQKDELLLIQCRRIEAAYLRRFGPLELKVYETWCGCLRAKRKAKLIRARHNRRTAADLREIEAELDGELSVYREELEARFQKVAGVMEKHEGPGLSPKGAKELKELYRQAVKALHPDLHPQEDETREKTLDQAMRAYRAGDLGTLRAICDSLESSDEAARSGLEELREEADRLRRALRELDRQLDAIKKAYPYNARPLLEDEALGKAHEQELTEQLRDLNERTARYEAAIEEMLAREEDDAL